MANKVNKRQNENSLNMVFYRNFGVLYFKTDGELSSVSTA